MEVGSMPASCQNHHHASANSVVSISHAYSKDNTFLNRKHKPPNLSIEEPAEDSDASSCKNSPECSYVTLRKQVISITTAAMNSPVVRRSSRLGDILEIPDVAAALVRDEGFELLHRSRRASIEKSTSKRQQTPGVALSNSNEAKFSFDETNPPADVELESNSGSDSSSLQSTTDASTPTSVEQNVKKASIQPRNEPGLRPRLELSKTEPGNIQDVYNLISDSSKPKELFDKKFRKKNKKDSDPNKLSPDDLDDDDSIGTPTTPEPGKRSIFSLFRVSSGVTRSPSNSSLQGWDSLARALARVGASTSSLFGIDPESFELNPKLTPILKRRSEQNWNDFVPQDPGTRPTLRKKTVSFSRLPSEASVKNSADCVSLMRNGHQFVKMRSNSRVYNRLYWLDDVNNCLRWEPSKKDSGKAKIDVTGIREVRAGKTTDLFLSSDISTHFPEECSFSIVYGEGKTLDLIANSADDANVWVTGLRCLMSGQDAEGLRMRSDARDTWLCSMFDNADINGDGFLDEDESLKLLKSLSDGIREFRIKQKLQEHVQLRGTTDRSRLTKDEFVEIFKDVATRPEVYFLLARFASRDDRLSVNDLQVFLETEQGLSDVTTKMCEDLIATYEPSKSLKSIPALGIDGFTKYLLSDQCGLLDPKHLQVCQDMTQPMSHYFIASSHNTYLMEDQVIGPSSVSAYVRALLRCCRCVELDCWDGSDGEPVVTHGHTQTNQIPFRQVIEAIGESAFRNSIYPVILSIENHCSDVQQNKMADDLVEVLGDRIYRKLLSEEDDFLPSPESLKNFFLIRSKKLPPDFDGDVGVTSEDDEGFEVQERIPENPNENLPSPLPPPKKSDRKLALVRPLSDLVSICACAQFRDDFDSHRESCGCDITCSLHELQAIRYVESCPEQFATHNKKYLTRVYPRGTRYDSSNFNPQDFWNCGVQIAALNYQTPGLMMDINDGRFAMNGGCGFVLKPDVMREPMAFYNPLHSDAIPGVTSKILHLRIISGQNFPKPRGGGAKGHVIDPYVLIELFGVPVDCAEQRTRTAPNNSGESPVFDESFEFRLTLPDLALVRFVVLDDEFIGDEFIGQYTIPLECMRPGYRHLRLRSIFDEPLDDATLFIHVAISDCETIVVSPSTGPLMTPQGVQPGGTLKKRGNSSQKRLKKSRSRKDIDFVTIRDTGIPVLDDIFRKADSSLRQATSIRDAYRWSLSQFRDACYVAPSCSVKQCVRAIASRSMESHDLVTPKLKRTLSSSADGDPQVGDGEDPRKKTHLNDVTRLRRLPSESSQTSFDSPLTPAVALLRHDRRIYLEVKGHASGSEFWKRVAMATDALVANCITLLDNADDCCRNLTVFCQSAETLYKDVPKLLLGGATTPLSPTGESPLGVANGSSPAPKKSGKSSQKKKSQVLVDGDRKRRHNVEENIRWNSSAIKGQADLLRACREEASKCLADLWETALNCGIASEKSENTEPGNSNGLESSENRNGNNNSANPHHSAKYNGTKNRFSAAKHVIPPFTRSRGSPSNKKHGGFPHPVSPL